MDDSSVTNSFNSIEKQYQALSDNPSASLVDLRHLLLDVEELISSPEYPTLASDQRNTLQADRKDLIRRINELENGGVKNAAGADGHQPGSGAQPAAVPQSVPARPEPER